MKNKGFLLIGLTGNIGTGKSSIRKMMQHLGALGIDADRVARDALRKDSPAYQDILAAFGREAITDPSGQIDRKKLGALVFSNPAALKKLESITHPQVSIAIKQLIQHSRLPVIVIEAIKLLESDLAELCDSIWVVDTQPEIVYERLRISRGMSRAAVEQRLAQQSPAAEKIRRADIVIHNNNTTLAAWEQVRAAWKLVSAPLKEAAQTSYSQSDIHILLPSNANRDLLQKQLNQQPESLACQVLSAQYNSSADRSNTAWTQDEEKLNQILLQSFILRDEASLALVNLDHFTCQLSGYSFSKGYDRDKFHDILSLAEKFGNLHLCRSFSIPIKKEEASFICKKGYRKQPEGANFDQVYQKAGYNLYIKSVLRPF